MKTQLEDGLSRAGERKRDGGSPPRRQRLEVRCTQVLPHHHRPIYASTRHTGPSGVQSGIGLSENLELSPDLVHSQDWGSAWG